MLATSGSRHLSGGGDMLNEKPESKSERPQYRADPGPPASRSYAEPKPRWPPGGVSVWPPRLSGAKRRNLDSLPVTRLSRITRRAPRPGWGSARLGLSGERACSNVCQHAQSLTEKPPDNSEGRRVPSRSGDQRMGRLRIKHDGDVWAPLGGEGPGWGQVASSSLVWCDAERGAAELPASRVGSKPDADSAVRAAILPTWSMVCSLL